ncbi:hypothetical protein BHM03_00007633 [Ensete ventricosum]|nr:hypothetical protein BHM03_00007633 [Ensete ventricosum]
MIELMREEHETLRIPQYLFSRVLQQQQDEAEDKASFFFPFRSRKENERSKKTDFNHVAERQCVGPGGQRLLSPIGRSRSQRAIHRTKEADGERPYNRVTRRGATVAHRRHVGGHPVGLRVTSSPSCRCGMLYYPSDYLMSRLRWGRFSTTRLETITLLSRVVISSEGGGGIHMHGDMTNGMYLDPRELWTGPRVESCDDEEKDSTDAIGEWPTTQGKLVFRALSLCVFKESERQKKILRKTCHVQRK